MNKLSTKKIIILVLSIVVVGLILDQLTKLFFEGIQSQLPKYWWGTVGFTWRENTGGAWSILSGKSIVLFLFTIFSLPLFGVLLYFGRQKSIIGIIGYSGIISGTLGNAIDRAVRGTGFYNGAVRDFLSIGQWFPVFNVADMLLVGGVIFVLIALFFLDDDAVFRPKKPNATIESE